MYRFMYTAMYMGFPSKPDQVVAASAISGVMACNETLLMLILQFGLVNSQGHYRV